MKQRAKMKMAKMNVKRNENVNTGEKRSWRNENNEERKCDIETSEIVNENQWLAAHTLALHALPHRRSENLANVKNGAPIGVARIARAGIAALNISCGCRAA
jgi:hypothetical protein